MRAPGKEYAEGNAATVNADISFMTKTRENLEGSSGKAS
jgi:hypothetical protein